MNFRMAFARHAARARTGGGSPMSRPSSSRHRVQASRSRGNQAAQGALLSGTPRRRVRAQDGGSSVCLPRGPGPGKAAAKAEKSKKPVAIVCYDEKPESRPSPRRHRILPPVPGRHASFARDHEYKRHGTLSLLAGIDLLTGKVHASVRELPQPRVHRIPRFSDAAYPASTAIKLILDNHSGHTFRGKPEPGSTPGRQAASTLPSRPSTAPGST